MSIQLKIHMKDVNRFDWLWVSWYCLEGWVSKGIASDFYSIKLCGSLVFAVVLWWSLLC